MITTIAFFLTPLLGLSATDLFAQLLVTLVVVAGYHMWASRRKPAATQPVPVISAPKPVSVSAPIAAPQAAPAPVRESFPPELAAVIAAAVAVVLDRPHRVLAVQSAQAPELYQNAWSLEGRTQIFLSHKTR